MEKMVTLNTSEGFKQTHFKQMFKADLNQAKTQCDVLILPQG